MTTLCPLVLCKRPSALIVSQVAAGRPVHKEAGVSEVRVSDQKISISLVTVSRFGPKAIYHCCVQTRGQTRTEGAVSFIALVKFQKDIITLALYNY